MTSEVLFTIWQGGQLAIPFRKTLGKDNSGGQLHYITSIYSRKTFIVLQSLSLSRQSLSLSRPVHIRVSIAQWLNIEVYL